MTGAAADQSGQSTEPQPQPVVMKFGGTSLEDASAIRRAIRIVKHRLRSRPVVIASAFAEVTDQLLAAGNSAARGELQAARASLDELRRRHEQVALDAAGPALYESLRLPLDSQFHQLDVVLDSIATAGELTPRFQDQLLGAGECLSSRIVSAAFANASLDAVWVDESVSGHRRRAHPGNSVVGGNEPARAGGARAFAGGGKDSGSRRVHRRDQ